MVEGLGFEVETDGNFRKDAYLFGESQSRVIISVKKEMEDELVNQLSAHNVSFSKLGEVKGDRMVIDAEDYGVVTSWKQVYDDTLTDILEAE
jgi:phosphoribosylformylglycinamidine synthase